MCVTLSFLCLSLLLCLFLLSLFRRKGSTKETLTGDRKESKSYPLLTQKQPIREPGNNTIESGNACIHICTTTTTLLCQYLMTF